MRPLPAPPDSKVAFFVNGRCQGVAFRELYAFRPLRAPSDTHKAQAKKRAREGAREHKKNHFDDGSLDYFPLISLFNGARVRLNPGPDFAFHPPSDIDAVLAGDGADNSTSTSARTWRQLYERYSEFMKQQWSLDRHEEEQARVEATQRAATLKAEAEKKSERERKRTQANAKRRARREATHAATAHAGGPNTVSNTPQPE